MCPPVHLGVVGIKWEPSGRPRLRSSTSVIYYIYIYIYTCLCVCVCVCVCTYTHVHTHKLPHTCQQTYVCMYVYT